MKIILITFLSGVCLAAATNDASSNTINAHNVQNSSSVPPHPPVNPGAHGVSVNPAKDDVAATPLPRTMKEDQEKGFSTVVAKQKRDVVTITPGPIHDLHHEPGQDVDKVTSPSHATALPQVIQTGRQNGPRIARQTNHTETETVGRRPYSHGVEHHTISQGAEIIDAEQLKDHTLSPDHPLAKDDVYTTPNPLNITLRSMVRRHRDVTVMESPQYKESDKTAEGVTQVPKTKREVEVTTQAGGPIDGNVGAVSSGSALHDVKGNPIVMSGPLLVDPTQLKPMSIQQPPQSADVSATGHGIQTSGSIVTPRSKRDADGTTQATGPVEGNIGSVASGSALQDIKGNPIVMQGSLLRDESQLHILATQAPTPDAAAAVTPAFDASDVAVVTSNVVTVEPVNPSSTLAARRRRDVDATTQAIGPVEGNVGSVASGSALQDVKGNPIVMQGSLLRDESQLHVLMTPQPNAGDASATAGTTSASEPMTASVQSSGLDTTQVVKVNVPVEVHVSAATLAPARRRRSPDVDGTTPSTGPVVGNIGSVSSGSALQDVKGNPIVMQGGLLRDESQLHVLASPQSADASASVATTQGSAEPQASVQPVNVQLPSAEASATTAPSAVDTTTVLTVNVPVEVHVSAATVAPARRRRDADGTTQATGPVEGNVGSVASGSALQDVKGNPIVMQGSLLRDESQLHVLITPQPSAGLNIDARASVRSTQASAESTTASLQAVNAQLLTAGTSVTVAPSGLDTTSVVTVNVPVEVHVSAATVASARRRRDVDGTTQATGPVEGNVGSVASGSALQDVKGNPIVMQGSLLRDESQLHVLITPQPSAGQNIDASANVGTTQASAEPITATVRASDAQLSAAGPSATAAPSGLDTTSVVTVNVPVEVHISAATVAPARRRRSPDETLDAPVVKVDESSKPMLTAAFAASNATEGAETHTAQPATTVDSARGSEVVKVKREANETSNPATAVVAAMDGTAASLYRKDKPDHPLKDDPAKTQSVDQGATSDNSAHSDKAINLVPADASKLSGDHTMPPVFGTSSQHPIA